MTSTAKTGKRRGRPLKDLNAVAAEAAFVIEVAIALKLGRVAQLSVLQFAQVSDAYRFVARRRRGAVSVFIGSDVRALVYPAMNKTRRALQLIVEHGMPVAKAASAMKIDRRNLARQVPRARIEAAAEHARTQEFAIRSTVKTISLPEVVDPMRE